MYISAYENEKALTVIHSFNLFLMIIGCFINAWLARHFFNIEIDVDKAAEIIIIALMWHLCATLLDKTIYENTYGVMRKVIICISSVSCYVILDKTTISPFCDMVVKIVVPLLIASALTRWIFRIRIIHILRMKTIKLLRNE